MLLKPRFVAKPWGRDDVPHYAGDERIGEAWFEGPASPPLLIKYLYTSEPLSIQVHPDDKQARAAGLPAGKTECWYIVAADPGAVIGLGLRQAATGAVVRAAARDGSLADLLDWRVVTAGDFLFVPGGTVHAIGAGITLIEIQQNSDITYRLFDYGRPRPLQLDAALDVAHLEPYRALAAATPDTSGNRSLADGVIFSVRYVRRIDKDVAALVSVARWIIPLTGVARSAEQAARPGDCLYVAADEIFALDADTSVLIAAAGA